MDLEIADSIDSFKVEKCQRYTDQEFDWKWFQCIPCNYTSTKFTTVMSNTQEYWDELADIYKVMYDNMNLK